MKRFHALVFILITAVTLQAQPLGTLTEDLVARDAYFGQSSYMNFYHALALSQDGVDISMAALLSVDGVIPGRPMREKDVNRLYPFDNSLTVLRMTGEEVRKYLEASYNTWVVTLTGEPGPGILLKSTAKADGTVKWNFKNSPANFDSAGGLVYTVDLTCESGSRVKIERLSDGRPFEADATYHVGITNYRASGAGKLLQAAGIDPKNMEERIVSRGKLFREIVREFFKEKGTVAPGELQVGRWSFVPAPEASEAMALARAYLYPGSQNPPYNAREEIFADIERAGANYYLYPQEPGRPTRAPKGYKPFYMSHLGRHGSRYALGATIYSDLWKVWSSAHEKALLTPEGEAVFQAYAQLYPAVAKREGILTQIGQKQHRFIARQMFSSYPALFKGHTQARVISTHGHRVLVSMYAFLSELESLDKDLSLAVDYGEPYQQLLLPDIINAPSNWPAKVEKKNKRFRNEVLDLEGIMERWFTTPDSLVKEPYTFCQNMHTIVSDLDNLDIPVPEKLYQVFTPEERYRLYEATNYNGYLRYGMSPEVPNTRPLAMKPLLEEMIRQADEAISGGEVQVDLRFAHDESLLPLLCLVDVNGMGVVTDNPYELENWWRTYDIPMACNLQLVFFRSKRNPEILFQILLNGREATLPLEMAAPGSFYRWEDFKALVR